MNKKIKTKWINALRSNRYKQTTGALKERSSYCCLGVLLKTTRKMTDKELNEDQKGRIPCPIRCDLGITRRQEKRLIQLNDKEYKSFQEIANYIEKWL